MNYSELVTAINNYVEVSFATSDVNTFIRQAEKRIYLEVQFPFLRKNVVGVAAANVEYLETPDDFLSVYSIAVIDGSGNYEYLINKDVSFIRAAYPNPSDAGIPRYYAIFGPATTNTVPPAITNELSFILGPTPNSNYSVELHYFYFPESIVTAGTTWLGDNFDNVLLCACLIEAGTFLKSEQDVMVMYEAKYKEALRLAGLLGAGLERGDAYRSGQLKLKVT